MHSYKHLIPLTLIAIVTVLIDQTWKSMVLQLLVYGHAVTVVKGFFSLNLVFNTGAAFGILPGKKMLFLILPFFVVIVAVIVFLRSSEKSRLLLPFGLLLGGTIGNFIDRIRYGCVIDFFDFYWQQYHWPAFNFADTCICIGVVLLMWQMIWSKEFRG